MYKRGKVQILTYNVTVLVLNLPFIYFFTTRAGRFGLSRLIAFLTSLILCLASIVLPWFLFHRVLWIWIVVCIVVISCSTLLPLFKSKYSPNDQPNEIEDLPEPEISHKEWALNFVNAIVEKEHVFAEVPEDLSESETETPTKDFSEVEILIEESVSVSEEQIVTEELEELPEEEILLEESVSVSEPQIVTDELEELPEEEILLEESVSVSEPQIVTDELEEPVLDEPLSIEMIINQGFEAKNCGRYLEAAGYFIQALNMKPEPDIAFCLMTDTYTMLSDGNSPKQLIDLLESYWVEYFDLFSSEYRLMFLRWIDDQKINITTGGSR